ncbi:hypothetical protein SAMN05216551_11021 [Chitinasiproducens palmae]|uniref:Uncharacterized protein n=1 Tax=Chitinasiproducens palmae TaxID=1770053 RepID=A0A1H2PSL6_9BURK|nr:hypothetical protein SAMN05216551_11021 [Chitinasiproducens palmae]
MLETVETAETLAAPVHKGQHSKARGDDTALARQYKATAQQ